jgi:ABC-2 type transport system permease protein
MEAMTRARAASGKRRRPLAPAWRALAALVARELSSRKRSVIGWGISGGLLCALTTSIYPSVSAALSKAIAGYPSGLKEAFGVGNLGTVEQYLAVEAFNMILPLAVSYFAIRSIVRAIPAAEEAGYLDVLLSAPLSRRRLVLAEFAATALALALVMAIVGAFTWVAAHLAGADLSLGLTVAGIANVVPLALLFAGIAAVASGARRGSATATGVAAGALVTLYVFDLVGKLADGLDWLRYVSVFKYYGSAIENGIDPLAFGGILLVAIALMAAGALLFERRDVLP